MRIGKGIHPEGVPGWCQGFSLDGGSGVRAVKVIQPGNRPGLIYNIGKSFKATTNQPIAKNTLPPRFLLSFYPMQESVCAKEKVATETPTL